MAHAAHVEPLIEEKTRDEFSLIEAKLQEEDVPLDDISIWIDPIGVIELY